jgi:hypothetical protein
MRLTRARYGRPRPHYLFQGVPLVFHVLLAGLDQLWQLIVTLLEQHIDIRPCLADRMLESDEIVVNDDTVSQDKDQNTN